MSINHRKDEISFQYQAKVTLCANGHWKGQLYQKPLCKMREGFEKSLSHEKVYAYDEQNEVKKILGRRSHQESEEKEFRKDSLNRTRDTLIMYASENESLWRSFVTLTYAVNETDIDKAYKDFQIWVRQIKRIFPEFVYICVPEFQKRGAIHFHLICNAECGKEWVTRPPKITFNTEKKRAYTLYWYDLQYWNHGYSIAEDLKAFDSEFNVALYLVKYLFKDADTRLWGRNKILKSNSLRKPKTYYLNSETYKQAVRYIQKKGYQVILYDFEPVEKYQTAFTASSLKERLSQEDNSTVSRLLKNGGVG